jgi:hypothetical protein
MLLALSFLSEKARGTVTGSTASSDTIAMKPTDFLAIAGIRMAGAASTAIKGSAITQAPEVATKTSPMAKINPW